MLGNGPGVVIICHYELAAVQTNITESRKIYGLGGDFYLPAIENAALGIETCEGKIYEHHW